LEDEETIGMGDKFRKEKNKRSKIDEECNKIESPPPVTGFGVQRGQEVGGMASGGRGRQG